LKAKNGVVILKQVKHNHLTNMLACVLTIIITIAALGLNMHLNISMGESEMLTHVSGSIKFSGGYDYGEDAVYVNPSHAEISAYDDNGSTVKLLDWCITKSTFTEPIFNGTKGDLNKTLDSMCKDGPAGLFVLQIRVETESEDNFIIGRNFFIVPENPRVGNSY
jgi:hypothetical protein